MPRQAMRLSPSSGSATLCSMVIQPSWETRNERMRRVRSNIVATATTNKSLRNVRIQTEGFEIAFDRGSTRGTWDA